MIGDVAKKIISMSDAKSLGLALAQVLDLKGLSKDLVVALTDKAAKQKEVLVEVVANEFSSFLSKINVAEEMQKAMDGMTVSIEAKIQFKDKAIKTKPVRVSSTVKSKKTVKSKNSVPGQKKHSVRRGGKAL